MASTIAGNAPPDRDMKDRVGPMPLAWGVALLAAAAAAVDFSGAGAQDLAGLAVVAAAGVAALAYWLRRRLRALRLRALPDGVVEVARGATVLDTCRIELLRPWSPHKARADLVRGGCLGLMTAAVGALMLAVEPGLRGPGLALVVLGVITLADVVHGHLRRWTIEVPRRTGDPHLLRLSREDVVRLLGAWPRDAAFPR